MAPPAQPRRGGEAEKSAEGSRSNEITIKFINILLLPKDTLATTSDPKKIAELIDMLKDHGITPMLRVQQQPAPPPAAPPPEKK